MDWLKIVPLSLGSSITLFILTKLMGNREMSQLSMFDYIISITIGSIAAEMSTALENDFMQPLIAMTVYACVSITISLLSCKFLGFRRFIYGNSLVLFDNGIIYRKNLQKAKLDINEFLMECRANGYFNLSDIQTAILEANGKVSFLPISNKKPATPADLNIDIPNERICVNIILDGILLKGNLHYTGNDEIWLQNQLTKQGYYDTKNIFLATCDSNNKLSIYKKEELENSNDFFM